MKLLVLITFLSLSCYSFITTIKQSKYLEIFIMSSFRNDSINLRTEVSNNKSFRVNTQLSIGQATSFYLNMTESDSTIFINDVIGGNYDSVRYRPEYRYLYIYYKRPKFTFEFSNKLLSLE